MDLDKLLIKPMADDFILWRCLHHGPLSPANIAQLPAKGKLPFTLMQSRNIPLLEKLIRLYGSCAILARDGDLVVGVVRFYPKDIWQMKGAGYLCLQQEHPAGPAAGFPSQEFPHRRDLKEPLLKVHCLMVASPGRGKNPYLRQRIGSRMIQALIQWARENNWHHIEADAWEDLPLIYQITGDAGHSFWKKLGFHVADRFPHPHLSEQDEFVARLEEQAREAGLDPKKARDQIVMRLDLN
jgi:GNAT superfamily N-acetyltransferase